MFSAADVPVEGIRRVRMSYEEFMRLPDSPRNEWVDGEVLLMPPVGGPHGETTINLAVVLKQHLQGLKIGAEIGVQLPRNRVRGPDLLAAERLPAHGWVTEPPVLVVEVLSRSTRSEDTIRKSMEYAEGGISQYWLVDPDLRTIDVLLNNDGAWDMLAHVDDDHPTADISVGEFGTVPLDLRDIIDG